jgi:hypothetical protein
MRAPREAGKAPARVLEHVAGPRAANRVVRGIPAARIHQYPQLAIAARVRRCLRLSGQNTTAADRTVIRIFATIARQCGPAAVVGTRSSCMELSEDRAYRIMEQVSPPPRYERAVAAQELIRFPGWAPEGVTRSLPWDHRMVAEWQTADLILVPSRHLISISQEFGADPLKLRVGPYPIAGPQPARTIRNTGKRRAGRSYGCQFTPRSPIAKPIGFDALFASWRQSNEHCVPIYEPRKTRTAARFAARK